MSWRDRFNAIGSFRGAKFVVPSNTQNPGRRVQVHELPLRDDPVVEDMGANTKERRLAVFVSGDDYDKDRDKLVEALNKPGPGILVHPREGSLRVTLIDGGLVRESTRNGGRADFDLTFLITPAEPVFESADTQAVVEQSTLASIADSINDFSDNFDVLDQAADYVEAVQDDLNSVMGAIDNAVTGVTDDINALVRTPYNMATAIAGTFNSVKSTLNNSLNTFNLYKSLFDSSGDQPTIPLTTPSRVKQAENTAAQRRLIGQLALCSACQISAEIEYASLDDAVAMRDVLLDAIDDQAQQPMTSELYNSYAAMRAAVVADLRSRGMQLPKLINHTPKTTLPALVIAHQIYGDATREAELVERNSILHPGFISGGQSLEVLADV